MKTIKLIFIIFFIIISKLYSNDKDSVIITISKSGCLGQCPIYSATIYFDGTVEYRGDANVKFPFSNDYKIPSSAIDSLLKAFETAKFFELNNSYDGCSWEVNEKGDSVRVGMGITDRPSTTISIHIGKDWHNWQTVVYTIDPPTALIKLENDIIRFAELFRWN
jgi:hypothetical protein